MIRGNGAEKIFIGIASPPVKFPNVYGLSIPTHQDLIAVDKTEEEVAKELKADWVSYLPIEGLKKSILSLEGKVKM